MPKKGYLFYKQMSKKVTSQVSKQFFYKVDKKYLENGGKVRQCFHPNEGSS